MRVMYRDQQYEMKGGMTARDLIVQLGLNPEAILVLRNGKLVDDSVLLADGDEVKLVAVISGG